MSAPSKDLVVQVAENAAIGKLPPAVQQQLELRKLSNQVAAQLAGTNWGKGLDHTTRRAVADWGRQFRVDVTIEINVLGGNVYLNAYFYLRQLSEMIEEGLVEYAYADHVEHDDRLALMGPEGEGEGTRRLRERLMHGIPDAAKSAVIFRVKLRSMTREVSGAKWCGGGTRKSDPVGDAFPVETSESRAARRAMRLLRSHVPKARADEIDAIETSSEALSDRLVEAHRSFVESERRINTPGQPMTLPAGDDPYGASTTVPVEIEYKRAPGELIEQTKAEPPKAPIFAELAASIARLLKHEKLTDEQRAEFTVAAAEAQKAEDLERIIGQIEDAVAVDGDLGL